MKYLSIVVLIILLLPACDGSPGLPGFNSEAWKKDKNGCEGIRKNMVDQLDDVKEEIKGLKEKQVIKVLGRPDIAELYKRGQRFYKYNISPGKNCNVRDENDINLVVRFNSLGIANEVNIEQYQYSVSD